ncbi:hypothetical protein M878_44595 [Streptomyces roseochromogenus subsp. oscitans DS 12.976]|uniref:Uncharacterized protein n=1 Tax=Streptomyces roseochromogenus subsp. oscitans DS 12.976 TaxID=1352936 RepID=V6JHW8_STRRC|nr:hypothetical protein M878_44595 [Streptomyces roseochromogenus subsp. oscitans DS 12.976]
MDTGSDAIEFLLQPVLMGRQTVIDQNAHRVQDLRGSLDAAVQGPQRRDDLALDVRDSNTTSARFTLMRTPRVQPRASARPCARWRPQASQGFWEAACASWSKRR